MNRLPTNPNHPQEIDGAQARPWRSTRAEEGAWDAAQNLYWTPVEEKHYTDFYRKRATEVRDQVMHGVHSVQEEVIAGEGRLRSEADELTATIADITRQVRARQMSSAEAARKLGTLRTQTTTLADRLQAYSKTQAENARIAEDPWAYDDELRRRFDTLKNHYWPW